MALRIAFATALFGALFGLLTPVAVLAQGDEPEPTSEAFEVCPDPITLSEDIDLVMAQVEPMLSRLEWALTINNTGVDAHMIFEWRHHTAPRLVWIDLIRWVCGYTDHALEAYFSDETMDMMVGSWEQATLVRECKIEGVRIFEYLLESPDGYYIGRFWADPLSQTRVALAHIYVPVMEVWLLNYYGGQLYPDAVGCPIESEGEDQ